MKKQKTISDLATEKLRATILDLQSQLKVLSAKNKSLESKLESNFLKTEDSMHMGEQERQLVEMKIENLQKEVQMKVGEIKK